MRHDVNTWFRREQRKVARLPQGLAIRLTVRFTHAELRLLADSGIEITPSVLRRWIRDEAVVVHLNGLRQEDEFWRSTRESGDCDES